MPTATKERPAGTQAAAFEEADHQYDLAVRHLERAVKRLQDAQRALDEAKEAAK